MTLIDEGLLNVLRDGGCQCDPPGSGEQFCTGHCVLRADFVQERKEREVMAEQRDQAVSQLDALRAENERLKEVIERSDPTPLTTLAALRAEVESLQDAHAIMKNVADGRKAEIERLRAVVAEVRKLEAVDHGVAWPDLCHALYELDRSNCSVDLIDATLA